MNPTLREYYNPLRDAFFVLREGQYYNRQTGKYLYPSAANKRKYQLVDEPTPVAGSPTDIVVFQAAPPVYSVLRPGQWSLKRRGPVQAPKDAREWAHFWPQVTREQLAVLRCCLPKPLVGYLQQAV